MKYALLIGILYEKSNIRLRGTSNDIQSINQLLINWGFNSENITILNEDDKVKPTGFNINTLLNRFVSNLKYGDKAFIFYSGHGMLVKNKLGNKESCIVPMDYKKTGVITSETIRYYLNKVSPGVNVLCLFDCCNSGSICDLKYHIYDTSYKKNISSKMRKYDADEWTTRQHKNINPSKTGSGTIETVANIVSVSGCWDDQVSYDLIKNGALTMSFLSVINFHKPDTLNFEKLLQYIRGSTIFLRLNQTPQLMTGRDMNEITLKQFLDL
jgi:hypothetical protein